MRSYKLGPQKIVSGEDAIQALAELPAERKRAYIVMSGTIQEELGQLKMVTDVLEGAGFTWKAYTDVEPEPSWKTVLRGAEDMKEFEPDWVIGFGGGSAMDAAKAMWVFYENPDYTCLADVMPPNEIKTLKERARVCCIPTSAGTGSEATRAALVKDTDEHKKYSIRCMRNRMVPDVAILDPVFSTTMPPSLTAGSGMDALTHAIETYVATNANPLSDAMAIGGFITGFNNLATCYDEPENLEARAAMLEASCMAGIAFSNAALGIVHSIAHTFGAIYGVPHGMANAIVLPYGLAFNAEHSERAAKRYAQLASMVGVEDLTQAIIDLRAHMNVPSCMKEVVTDEAEVMAHIDRLVAQAQADVCTPCTPHRPTDEEMRELILKVYNGR